MSGDGEGMSLYQTARQFINFGLVRFYKFVKKIL